MRSIDFSPFASPLEDRFSSYWDVHVDITRDDFEDYLEPNEGHPEEITTHLELAEKEIVVSTGTERTLFTLLFGDFKGLIGVDINHRVKAYNDFNLLLLRISKTREEYIALSQPTEDIQGRVTLIRKKMVGNLPDRVDSYYQKHLVDFASVYLNQKHAWKNEKAIWFEKCQYHKDEDQFSKLQAYARSGKIVYIIGDINKLSFLGESGAAVSVIDASNVHDYAVLNFKLGRDCTPRVIITLSQDVSPDYRSFVVDVSPEESDEFDRLINLIKSCNDFQDFNAWMKGKFGDFYFKGPFFRPQDPFNVESGVACSKKMLEKMREYVDKNIISIPGYPAYNMSMWPLCRLNEATSEQLEALSNHVEMKRFVNTLIHPLAGLAPITYLAFSKVEGWKEAIEEHFSSGNHRSFDELLEQFEKANLLDKFTQEFGSERLEALKLRK